MAADPTKRYHSTPCKNCGGTERLKSNRACVACARARSTKSHRAKRRNDPAWVERRNAQRRARYAGDPEYAERERVRARHNYESLDHIAYYTKQLRDRRCAALKRKEERHNGQVSH